MSKQWPFRRLLPGVLLASYASHAAAAKQLNMTPGVTPISHAVHDLHMSILWICAAIGTLVFGVMLYSLIKYRKAQHPKAASFHESLTVEIIWTIIPFFILIFMAIPATKVLLKLEDSSKPDMSIKITGHQWKWEYDYLDDDLHFFSNLSTTQEQLNNQAPKGPHYLLEVDNPLVVPTGQKIRFLTTSNDTLHAWWVPALAVKKDAIPGFINEAWALIETPGIYRGQCAELCGLHHGYMPIVIDARSPEDYQAWVKQQKDAIAATKTASTQKMSHEELMKKGETVYKTVCIACHQANGEGLPPAFPALKGSAMVSTKGNPKQHIDMVLHGKAGTAMQAFGAQLNDVDLAAVITYERNAWGNNTGDTVQPSDIQAARNSAPH